jgi:small subunit ribosomal protein S8
LRSPHQTLRKGITRILYEKGYILSYKFMEEGPQGTIKIALKYDPKSQVSLPSRDREGQPSGPAKYKGVDDIPRVLNGLGIAIISTSKGLMTDKEASSENVGGEVLCYVY